MTTPPTPPQPDGAATLQLIDEVCKLWVEAGEKSDSPEGLGIDGRIALLHRLCDLWVKAWAASVSWLVTTPIVLPGSSGSATPLPSDPIAVPATSYPRQLKAKGPFERLGLPGSKLPISAIAFDPPFLPAGLTQFRIVLKDYNYIGANYQGTVVVGTQSLVPDEIEVTVGL